MNTSPIDEFIATCHTHKDKTAFVCRRRSVSFDTVLSDMYRMVGLFQANSLKPGDKVLILVPPSYEFYLLMLAGICYGLQLVAPDSYKDIHRIKTVMEENGISCVCCNRLTGTARPLFGRRYRFLNIERYRQYPDQVYPHDNDTSRIVLTTFTSGTTGTPKPIHRRLQDFQEQIRTLTDNIPMDPQDTVYCKLPIYSLFVVFKGLTCVIEGSLCQKTLRAQKVTAVLVPIARLLTLKEPLPFVKRVLIGGATLYPNEITALLNTFPNADITYIYGSSECVLMAKADLREFARTYAFQTDIRGVDVSVVNTDEHGVGQIRSCGRVVLTASHEHTSHDLAYISRDGLHIVGRKEYSSAARYNYLLDRELLAENPHVTKGFSLVQDDTVHFVYTGMLSRRRTDRTVYHRFHKLPMDNKHRTKLDYRKAWTMIQK